MSEGGVSLDVTTVTFGSHEGISVDLSLQLVGGAITSFKSVWGLDPEEAFQDAALVSQ